MLERSCGVLGVFAFLAGFGAALSGCADEGVCSVGSEGCECTAGGACDPGLTCLSMICVNAGSTTDTQADNETTGESASNTTDDTADTSDTNKLDMAGGETDNPCSETGCSKVDMVFAMDGSASMLGEINALKAGAAFLDIVSTLEGLNCGDIDYRIGVTGDNDNGWVTPGGWADPKPWFDSDSYTPAEISTHFGAAATAVGNSGGAPLGCEHVLSSAVGLLGGDNTGFLRDDALLVLVLMSDVDDYGWYDQVGGNTCGLGCNVGGPPVATLQNTLVALKGGDPAGVSTIVIAGDPGVDAGLNFCGQPQSCATLNESSFHAERLYEFASLQTGMNGFTADICAGLDAVPMAVETALQENIDLACQDYTPVG